MKQTESKTEKIESHRIERTIYGTYVVKANEPLADRLYETCNFKKAEGVKEYLSAMQSAGISI